MDAAQRLHHMALASSIAFGGETKLLQKEIDRLESSADD